MDYEKVKADYQLISIQKNSNIYKQLEYFYLSQIQNVYISDKLIKVYVRKSKRLIDGVLLSFLDIANVEVTSPENYGKGIFTRFLTGLLERYPNTNIFVECVMNEHLEKKLKDFNFQEQRPNGWDLHMYLIKDNTPAVFY